MLWVTRASTTALVIKCWKGEVLHQQRDHKWLGNSRHRWACNTKWLFASIFTSKVSQPSVTSERVQSGGRCRSNQQLGEFNAWKSMGLDRLHPRVLRELTDVIARLHSIPLKGHEGWSKSLITGEKQMLHQSAEKAKTKLQPGQPHSSPWEVNKVSPLGAYFWAHKDSDGK